MKVSSKLSRCFYKNSPEQQQRQQHTTTATHIKSAPATTAHKATTAAHSSTTSSMMISKSLATLALISAAAAKLHPSRLDALLRDDKFIQKLGAEKTLRSLAGSEYPCYDESLACALDETEACAKCASSMTGDAPVGASPADYTCASLFALLTKETPAACNKDDTLFKNYIMCFVDVILEPYGQDCYAGSFDGTPQPAPAPVPTSTPAPSADSPAPTAAATDATPAPSSAEDVDTLSPTAAPSAAPTSA
jgi:hypothetical protein